MNVRLPLLALVVAPALSAELLVIRAGRVLDVEHRVVIEDRAVSIEDARILAV